MLICIAGCGTPATIEGTPSPQPELVGSGIDPKSGLPTSVISPEPDSREPTPVPEQEPERTTSADDPSLFAGKDLDTRDVVDYFTANDCVAVDGFNWACRRVSVEFTINPDRRIAAVHLLAPAPRTAGYDGDLPGGITFTDSPAELTEKLGRPQSGRAAPGASLRWQHQDRRLIVVFRVTSPLEIGSVQIT
jgi:hypothetical protein